MAEMEKKKEEAMNNDEPLLADMAARMSTADLVAVYGGTVLGMESHRTSLIMKMFKGKEKVPAIAKKVGLTELEVQRLVSDRAGDLTKKPVKRKAPPPEKKVKDEEDGKEPEEKKPKRTTADLVAELAKTTQQVAALEKTVAELVATMHRVYELEN
jgi:hypothetical protein